MCCKSLIAVIITFSFLSFSLSGQEKLNTTDQKGLKQGHWIKKDAKGHTLYDGFFKDNMPVGTFKRYHVNDTLQSVLVYSPDGTRATATFYHPNGNIASKGLYVNQKKEGKWQFYSAVVKDYLICEEEYVGNKKNGPASKYYQNKTYCEKLIYKDGVRSGEWIQYYPDGVPALKANYVNGKLDGSFQVFYDNGKPELTGQYKDDLRSGSWMSYNRDGSMKNKIDYVAGRATNPELSKAETDYLDRLEKNKGKIADPEITGTIW